MQFYWRLAMMTRVPYRYALCSCAATALLAGCGGTQALIGSPGRSDVKPVVLHQHTFQYTGEKQSFTVPAGVKAITVVALGAAGGGAPTSGNYDAEAGRGGRVVADLPVDPGERLAVFVGGTTNGIGGGYNGGGAGKSAGSGGYYPSFGGGGATDIREGGDALKDRVLVAGGGGGIGGSNSASGGSGGAGGNRRGGNGNDGAGGKYRGCRHSDGGGGGGASEHSGGRSGRKSCQGGSGGAGEFGIGGGGAGGSGGVGAGGGGGYFGGGGGGGGTYELDPKHYYGGGGGGGGGSSYVKPSATNARFYQGWKGATGNGQVVIRW
jgi:hypothetical protein